MLGEAEEIEKDKIILADDLSTEALAEEGTTDEAKPIKDLDDLEEPSDEELAKTEGEIKL